jgi:hypothetical protein
MMWEVTAKSKLWAHSWSKANYPIDSLNSIWKKSIAAIIESRPYITHNEGMLNVRPIL